MGAWFSWVRRSISRVGLFFGSGWLLGSVLVSAQTVRPISPGSSLYGQLGNEVSDYFIAAPAAVPPPRPQRLTSTDPVPEGLVKSDWANIGVGPGLSNFGVTGVLADLSLSIYQYSKAIATNEGWANSAALATAATQTGAFALPSGSKDAAVLITLNPGAYTAQIKSAKNTSAGIALIEIYEVP